MKSKIKVYNMNKGKDVIAINISLEKGEIQVIYNENFVDLDIIVESIEDLGYIII